MKRNGIKNDDMCQYQFFDLVFFLIFCFAGCSSYEQNRDNYIPINYTMYIKAMLQLKII